MKARGIHWRHHRAERARPAITPGTFAAPIAPALTPAGEAFEAALLACIDAMLARAVAAQRPELVRRAPACARPPAPRARFRPIRPLLSRR